MKKMLLATALALLITGCAQLGRLLFKTNRQQWHQRKPSPIISFLNWAEENWSMQPKFVAAQKMLATETTNIRKWIVGFYYFRHLYSAGSACVLLQ